MLLQGVQYNLKV